jgi:hypothetical protein
MFTEGTTTEQRGDVAIASTERAMAIHDQARAQRVAVREQRRLAREMAHS